MSHELAPQAQLIVEQGKPLSLKEHNEIVENFNEAAELAKQADVAAGERFATRYSEINDGNTRFLGDISDPAQVKLKENRDRIDVKIKDSKVLPNGKTRERNFHAHSDRDWRSGGTHREVRVAGGSKEKSDVKNPLVLKMLANIAINRSKAESQDTISGARQKAA